MSEFLTNKLQRLEPYTPGEQPKERKYIKLNTNESPFPPSEKAIAYARREAERLMLYSDPECRDLIDALSKDINTALSGRGGGRPEMIQGSFNTSLDKIKEYFK